jgi:hypothetical protein
VFHFFRKFTSFWKKFCNHHSEQETYSRLKASYIGAEEGLNSIRKIIKLLMFNLKVIILYDVKSWSLVSFWRSLMRPFSEWEENRSYKNITLYGDWVIVNGDKNLADS